MPAPRTARSPSIWTMSTTPRQRMILQLAGNPESRIDPELVTSCTTQRLCSPRKGDRSLRCHWPDGHRPVDLAPQNAPHRACAHRFSVRIIPCTWVELSGLEPLTSCMPSHGSTSTDVYTR